MKKVLLTTTAVVFTAGFASAGDMSMSGAIKLTYGSFGTGDNAGAAVDDFTSEADLDIAATSAGGIGVTYVKDQETSDNSMAVTYSAGALSLSLTSIDETNGPTDVAGGLQYGSGDVKTTIGATYVTGPYTISISGDDQDDQDWDASVAMASGDTTITVAADETEMMSVGIAYTNGAMTLSARQEFNNAAGTDDETEFSIAYTEGALTFGANYDSGQGGTTTHYGDEAELLISASYTDGDVTMAAKGTDQDEMEVSVTFAF